MGKGRSRSSMNSTRLSSLFSTSGGSEGLLSVISSESTCIHKGVGWRAEQGDREGGGWGYRWSYEGDGGGFPRPCGEALVEQLGPHRHEGHVEQAHGQRRVHLSPQSKGGMSDFV